MYVFAGSGVIYSIPTQVHTQVRLLSLVLANIKEELKW